MASSIPPPRSRPSTLLAPTASSLAKKSSPVNRTSTKSSAGPTSTSITVSKIPSIRHSHKDSVAPKNGHKTMTPTLRPLLLQSRATKTIATRATKRVALEDLGNQSQVSNTTPAKLPVEVERKDSLTTKSTNSPEAAIHNANNPPSSTRPKSSDRKSAIPALTTVPSPSTTLLPRANVSLLPVTTRTRPLLIKKKSDLALNTSVVSALSSNHALVAKKTPKIGNKLSILEDSVEKTTSDASVRPKHVTVSHQNLAITQSPTFPTSQPAAFTASRLASPRLSTISREYSEESLRFGSDSDDSQCLGVDKARWVCHEGVYSCYDAGVNKPKVVLSRLRGSCGDRSSATGKNFKAEGSDGSTAMETARGLLDVPSRSSKKTWGRRVSVSEYSIAPVGAERKVGKDDTLVRKPDASAAAGPVNSMDAQEDASATLTASVKADNLTFEELCRTGFSGILWAETEKDERMRDLCRELGIEEYDGGAETSVDSEARGDQHQATKVRDKVRDKDDSTHRTNRRKKADRKDGQRSMDESAHTHDGFELHRRDAQPDRSHTTSTRSSTSQYSTSTAATSHHQALSIPDQSHPDAPADTPLRSCRSQTARYVLPPARDDHLSTTCDLKERFRFPSYITVKKMADLWRKPRTSQVHPRSRTSRSSQRGAHAYIHVHVRERHAPKYAPASHKASEPGSPPSRWSVATSDAEDTQRSFSITGKNPDPNRSFLHPSSASLHYAWSRFEASFTPSPPLASIRRQHEKEAKATAKLVEAWKADVLAVHDSEGKRRRRRSNKLARMAKNVFRSKK